MSLKFIQLWIQAGEKNTTFFHNSAKTRLIKNNIEKIIGEGGTEIRGYEDIKKEVYNNFKSLLTTKNEQEDEKDFLKHILHTINEENNNEITKEVTEAEVMESIWSLYPDKAPGMDGFSISFYHSYWKLIKNTY